MGYIFDQFACRTSRILIAPGIFVSFYFLAFHSDKSTTDITILGYTVCKSSSHEWNLVNLLATRTCGTKLEESRVGPGDRAGETSSSDR